MVLTREWVRRASSSEADRTVLLDSDSGRQWTWRQLLSVTDGMARWLQDRGIGPGTKVGFSVHPGADSVLAFVAILRTGATVVAVDPAAPATAVLAAVRTVGAGFAICADAASARFGELPVVFPGELVAEGDRAGGSGGEPAGSLPDLDRAGADDVAVICFTSGTTGEPKAVPLTHGGVLAGCRSLVRAWEWTADDVLVSALPLFHVHGLLVAVAGSLTAGGTLVIQPRFDPGLTAADVERFGASMLFAVPTMWWRLAEAEVLDRLRDLRLAVSGSAPLGPDLFERIRGRLGRPPLERYGMTETMILTSNPVKRPRKPGSVGLPLPGVELRLGPGSVVEARSPSITPGYLNRPPGQGFTSDGWWRTGDIGRFDDDGYLFLRGRAGDLIITGGHNVQPSEVERVLAGVPGVAEVAVAGLPDERWGQVVGAFVVPAPGFAPDRLLSDLRFAADRELAPHQRPRHWRFLTELPRNAMGKVTRSRLAVVSPG